MQDTEKIGKGLKNARIKANLTQKQVADKAGVNANWYARLERGEEKASLDTLQNICKVLNVKVSDIIPF